MELNEIKQKQMIKKKRSECKEIYKGDNYADH